MKKAQYLAEVVIIISVVIAALIGMQTYIRRSVQANVKKEVDVGVQTAQLNIDQLKLPLDPGVCATAPVKPLMQYEAYYTDDKLNYGIKRATNEQNKAATGAKGKGNLTQNSYYSSEVKSQSKSYFDTSSNVVWQQ